MNRRFEKQHCQTSERYQTLQIAAHKKVPEATGPMAKNFNALQCNIKPQSHAARVTHNRCDLIDVDLAELTAQIE
jgi:hypothetical protein